MKKAVIHLLLVLMLYGCNYTITKKEAQNKLQSFLMIPVSDTFELTNYEQSSGIRDITEQFIIHFTCKEFDRILKKTNPQKINIIKTNLFGLTNEKGNKMTSAIFNPEECTIKYTYHEK